MTLTCAAFADEHHRFASRDVPAFSQLPNPGRRNLRRLREIKFLHGFHPRQLRIANPVADGVPVPLLALQRQQRFQVSNMTVILLGGLLRHGYEVGSHRRHPHRFAILPHAGLLQTLRRILHWMSLRLSLSDRSYSSITDMDDSNCTSSSASAKAYCRRCCGSGM